ncbi:hypothetical protein K492DRAFT_136394 [Lichtheimia hyalospora FSU 10163]|nr:hypothetical protein K492DRAFT_136394 [Lichtheimia hyalospora FSU 10163]
MHASLAARAAHTTSLASFMADRNVKLSWIAFFALWILWCLLWFLRHVFGDGHQGADYAGREEGDVAVNRPWIRHPLAIATHVCTYLFSRLSRATDVLRDLVLMLFSMLALNTLARGVQRQVMILCWVFFAFAVFWTIFEASYEHHMARLLYGIIFFSLSLSIGALAFRDGFQ